MEKVTEKIPATLHENLSQKLIDVVLGSQDKNAVPPELAKKIIYLWRQDQLATPTGIYSLTDAAVKVDAKTTYAIYDELGLKEIVAGLRSFVSESN
jgi:hypothetical protein